MGVPEILIGQGDLSQQISRLLANYKKSKARVTKPYIETRLELLESNFLTFKTNHSKILEITSSEEKKNLQYFKEDFYYNCEDEYLELKTLMKEHLEELAPRPDTPTKCCEHETMVTAPLAKYALKTKLPAIEIPSFSGNYNEWTSFYDLYKSLIHDNPELSNIQKYHYLKSNLKGDAELLLRQFPLTEANYLKALELLEARYNNKRLIVYSHITRLIGQKKLPLESAKGIRSLLDTTNESLNALDNVGVSTANWDPLVTHIIVAKFDSESHRLWEQRLGGTRDLPSTKDVLEFMEMRFRTLESLQITNPKEVTTRTSQFKTFKASTEPVCTLCSEDHYIHSCKEFTKLSPEERRDIAREKQLCFNCLIPRHSVRFCRQNTSCRICKRRHHSLLHLNTTEPQQAHATHIDEDEEEVRDDEETTQLAVHKADITGTQVLLATAMVRIRGKDGKRHALRALIDQGSQASFITTSAAQRLGLHREHVFSRVTGVDSNLSTVSKEIVGFNLFSLRDDKPLVEVKAHVLRTLSSILPRKEANITCAAEIKKLTLADPTFYQPSGIDLLLGAEVYAQILMEGVKRFGSVLAQNSLLGWLISGKVDGSHTEMNEVVVMHSQLQTDDILQRFWESEELHTKTRIQTASEAQCEKIFEETHSRTESGRYIVALPFSTDNETPLGESRSLAVKRLLNMERRFQRDEVFQQRYKGFMDEYEDLQHMEKVSLTDLSKPDVCYLPHHGVLREESTTTKLRVVFDGSAENSTGISLNEKLLIGPTLQHDIRDIFLRWRMHRVCLVADIQRMYRQILVRAEDQDYQRIVWRKSPADPINEYRLCTVTYGTSCAPYLAIKVLQQLACDERNAYPIAASVLERDFYVDDLLSGCDSEIDAIQLCKDLICLLEGGGFILHKWGSNSVDVLNSLPKNDSQPQEAFDIKMEKSVKTLGVKWNPRDYCFELNMNFSHDAHNKLTKRVVLSDIAKIYDPLGWLSPAVIVAKIFLQRLWLLCVGWDDELPVEVQSEWALFKGQVNHVEVITLPRWIGTTAANLKVEIHGFSDASNVAYAGVVYIRIIDTSGVTVKILAAKTKVAPIKQLSIPRLELCGAVLTAKLMDRIKICLNVPNENVYGWTDSTIVLAWLQKHPNSWKTFVGNRVAEILNVTRPTQWHHVNSNDNPADCASRGMSPTQLPEHELWWNGPSWLNSTNEIVANNEFHETDFELKLSTHTVNIDELPKEFIIQNYSSLMRLKRVIAYCLRFVKICKYKMEAKRVGNANNISNEFPEYLTSNELKRAMNCCVKMSQNCYFSEEIDILLQGQGVSKKSPLYFLHPFIDENELLRVGGRLKNAPIPRDTKHPFILSVYIGMMLVGYGMGWSAPVIIKLQDPDQTPLPEPITDGQASWVASVLYIGTTIGPHVSGYLSNKQGRKPALFLGGSLTATASLLLATAINFAMIIAGRILIGLGTGIIFVVSLVYLGEIAKTNIRGMLLTGTGIFMTLGTLVVFSTAPYISYAATSYLSMGISLVYIIGIFFIPETPLFYALKGKEKEAKHTLAFLGRHDEITTELDTQTKKQLTVSANFKDLFTIRENKKALFITITLCILQQLSGVVVVLFFATTIFELAGSTIEPNLATIIIGVTQLGSSVVSSGFVEKVGRKVLLLWSTAACFFSLTILGIYFYLDHIGIEVEIIGWLPLVCLVVFFLSYDMGFGIIPSTFIGEMYHDNVRSTGSAITITVGWLFGFGLSTAFGYMLSAIGGHFTFWIFAAACAFAFVFTVIFVPETKGKTLVQIQEMLSR